MKHRLSLALGLFLASAIAMAARAEFTNVHIEVEGRGGKGLAVSRGLDCFVITAAHVVRDPLPIVVVGVQRKSSPATPFWSDSGNDVAVIKVDKAAEICGRESYIDIDGLTALLERNRYGSFRVRNEDGSERDIALRLTGRDARHVFVEPNSSVSLGQRLSGSVLYVAGKPVGILVSISAGRKQGGRVYRIDRIHEQVGGFLPLAVPLATKARLDDQLAANMLYKHARYIETREFCRKLWSLAKWTAKPTGQIVYSSKRRAADGYEYAVKSMLLPGIESAVRITGANDSRRSVRTLVSFVPQAMDLNPLWVRIEEAIQKCIRSDVRKKVGKMRVRGSMRRHDVDKRTMWTVERTGFAGISMEDVDIWLSHDSDRGIYLRVWAWD